MMIELAIRITRMLLPGLMLVYMNQAAYADFAETPEETKMCKNMIYSRVPPNSTSREWGSLHHYCDCLRFTNRALSAMSGKNKNDVGHNLHEALLGCDYVIAGSPPNFELLPELHLQKGVIYSLRGDTTLAAAEFSKTLATSTKHLGAYTGLADIYMRLKSNDKALEVVSTGLKYHPDSKSLRRMYEALGGKLPYPTPATTLGAPAQTTATAADSGKAVTTNPAGNAQTGAQVPDEQVQTATAPQPEATDRPTNNPWCRFCPVNEAASPVPSPSTPGVIPKDWR